MDIISLRANVEQLSLRDQGLALKPLGELWSDTPYPHEFFWPIFYSRFIYNGGYFIPSEVKPVTAVFKLISGVDQSSFPQGSYQKSEHNPLFLDKESRVELMHILGMLRNDPMSLGEVTTASMNGILTRRTQVLVVNNILKHEFQIRYPHK